MTVSQLEAVTQAAEAIAIQGEHNERVLANALLLLLELVEPTPDAD